MTTTTNPGNYVDFDEYVGLKLEKTRSTIRTTDLLTAAAGVVAMVLGYLLVFVLLDQWVVRDGFSSTWRWLLLSTLVISTISWLVWKIGIPAFQTVNSLFAAQEIEKADPGLKSNLLNLIDLKRTGRSINPAILKALERRAAVQLQEIDVTHAIDHRPLIRTSYLLLTVIVLFSLYALISPKKISNSIWRGILPAANVPLATRTEILAVKPGNVSIPAHTPTVDIQVDLGGEIPHQVWLLYSTADGKFQRQPVEMRVEATGQTRFQGKLLAENSQGLMQDLTYSIRAGDAESEQFKVTVEQPPSAEIESIRIEFPPYMKLSPVEQTANGQIDAWEGAKVSLSAKTNMPVRSGLIRFLDDPQKGPTGEESAMSVKSNGAELQAAWTLALRTDGSFPKYYQIDCRTEDGRRDTSPTNYGLTIRPDLPPDVVLLQPDRDLEAPKNSIIPLLIQARDPDFELGYLYLSVEKGGQRIIHEQLSEGRQQKLLLKQELSLAALHLAVGEEIEVWIEAYDNKKPRPNTKNTPKIKIRVLDSVSKQEAEQQLAEQDSIREDKLAAAEQDQNQESSPMAPPSNQESQPRDPQQEPQPNEVASRQEQPAEASEPNEPSEGTNGNSPGKSAEKNSRQAAENPEKSQRETQQKDKSDSDKNSKGPPNETKGNDESQAPLSSDGSQDDEALKRINEKLNQDRKPSAVKPNEANATDPEQQRDAEKKPAAEKKPMPNGGDADADAMKEKAEEKDPSNTREQSAGKPETKKEKPQPQPKPTPESEPTKNGGPTEPPQPQPSEDPADDPAGDKESQPNGPKPKESDKPQDPAGAKPGEQSGQSEDSEQENSNSKTPGKTEAEDSGQDTPAAESNEKTPKKKPAPSAPKPANDANQPPSEPESTADQPETGEEAPADAPDGVKKNADGTEKGTAKPDRDPKSKPSRTNNDNVRRDPSEKPETRPGDSSAADQESEQPEKPEKKPVTSKTNSASKKPANQESAQDSSSNPDQAMKDPEAKKPAQKGPSRTEKPDKTENPSEEAETDTDTDTSPSEITDIKPEQSADSPQSKVKPKKSQNSTDDNSESEPSDSDPKSDPKQPPPSESEHEQPANSDAEGSKPDKSGRGDKGTGEKSASNPDGSKPGEESSSENKTENKKPKSDPAENQPSSRDKKPGKGPSEQKSPGEKSESGKGNGEGEGKKAGEGGSAAKPADSADSPKPGKPGGSTMSGGGIDGDGEGSATEGGESPAVAPGEEANMEYNRQATELILQKLNKQLERGEVDAELLEKLGWTQQEMKQFADRLSKHLQESKNADEAPESKARQLQFEEMLKNLDLQKSGTQRAGEKEPKRGVSQIEAKRTPVPPIYRSAYEKFTRDQARLKKGAGKK